MADFIRSNWYKVDLKCDAKNLTLADQYHLNRKVRTASGKLSMQVVCIVFQKYPLILDSVLCCTSTISENTVTLKPVSKVARMKVQVHIEWMEELDARGKRLELEVKELLKELEEIGRLKVGQEKEEEELRRDLAEEMNFKTKRAVLKFI